MLRVRKKPGFIAKSFCRSGAAEQVTGTSSTTSVTSAARGIPLSPITGPTGIRAAGSVIAGDHLPAARVERPHAAIPGLHARADIHNRAPRAFVGPARIWRAEKTRRDECSTYRPWSHTISPMRGARSLLLIAPWSGPRSSAGKLDQGGVVGQLISTCDQYLATSGLFQLNRQTSSVRTACTNLCESMDVPLGSPVGIISSGMRSER
jgi:hypothetical protein